MLVQVFLDRTTEPQHPFTRIGHRLHDSSEPGIGKGELVPGLELATGPHHGRPAIATTIFDQEQLHGWCGGP